VRIKKKKTRDTRRRLKIEWVWRLKEKNEKIRKKRGRWKKRRWKDWKTKTGNARIAFYWGVFVRPLFEWKSENYCMFDCVSVTLVIQHAKRMRRVILASVGICPHYLILERFSRKCSWT
jgi:hypothetical protein